MRRPPHTHGDIARARRATRRRRRPAILAAGLTILSTTSCSGGLNMLAPKGPDAAEVAGFWWPMLWMSVAVYALVLVLLAIAMLRARAGGRELRSEQTFILGWGVVMPVIVLGVLMVLAVNTTMRLVAWERDGDAALRIDVIGHMWWWEVRYPDHGFATANEIHVPAGTPVDLYLYAEDVIHSFWVPEIARKVDMIPGRENRMRIEVDRTGSFTGVCAEFCGLQHTRMRMLLVAQEPGDFETWARAQARPAPEPVDEVTARGQEVFLSATCIFCHAIRGTPAQGTLGPDLTHLASRATLAAAEVPNTTSWLAAWITDPHAIKRGVNMPGTTFSTEEMEALLAYLGSLR